ncbi:TSC22 domain family protein 3-like, partial [Heptranchias perlo]|uniref:TSC22 domain family protein 3-like n=1 Tax=Heptranchias perlo TaxID=212740 RepID=UPI003559A443
SVVSINLIFFVLCCSVSGTSVVTIDRRIEQAMDLVKNHLMFAVREEVEMLKEQIKELVEKNSMLERENSLLKILASPQQLDKFQSSLQPQDRPSKPETHPVGPVTVQHMGGSVV